jgi:hypothetical protein
MTTYYYYRFLYEWNHQGLPIEEQIAKDQPPSYLCVVDAIKNAPPRQGQGLVLEILEESKDLVYLTLQRVALIPNVEVTLVAESVEQARKVEAKIVLPQACRDYLNAPTKEGQLLAIEATKHFRPTSGYEYEAWWAVRAAIWDYGYNLPYVIDAVAKELGKNVIEAKRLRFLLAQEINEKIKKLL